MCTDLCLPVNYFPVFAIGFITGALVVYFALWSKKRGKKK